MVVVVECFQSPEDHRERVLVLRDTTTDERGYLDYFGGVIGERIEPPANFAEWMRCDSVNDRHELLIDIGDANISVGAARLINEASIAMDEIIIGPGNPTTINTSVIGIDGRNGILAQAGPTAIWTDTDTIATGVMEIDASDITTIDSSVVVHEMIHVLGFLNVPGVPFATFVDRDDLGQMVFTGEHATKAWRDVGGTGHPPLYEPDGGNHWDETQLRNEIQTPFSDGPANILSALTLGALIDIGYQVNRNAADRYNMRDALSAERCANCSVAV